MVWTYWIAIAGVGRSHGWSRSRQKHLGLVYQRFAPPQHHRHLFAARPLPAWPVYQNHLAQCSLHRGVQEPLRSVSHPDPHDADVSYLLAWCDGSIVDDATSEEYGYLMKDLHPASNDKYRLFASILDDQGYTRTWRRKTNEPSQKDRIFHRRRRTPKNRQRSSKHWLRFWRFFTSYLAI